jgi:hypothetical protein
MLDTPSSKPDSTLQDRIAPADLLDLLISGDGWRKRGFRNVNAFVASQRLDRDVAPDERKRIALRIKQLQPGVGNRAIAQLLGSSEPTIRRDVAPEDAPKPVIARAAVSHDAPTTLRPRVEVQDLSDIFDDPNDPDPWSASISLNWAKPERVGTEGVVMLDVSANGATPAQARTRCRAVINDLIAALTKVEIKLREDSGNYTY